MTSQPCRWGLLGAATIARKNWQAIHDAGNATLVAVASRDPARSAAFVADCQAQVPFAVPPAALESYEALLSRPDIDAVYLPLPTGIRKHWVLRAVRSGKHVLVEKPTGCNAANASPLVPRCGLTRLDRVFRGNAERKVPTMATHWKSLMDRDFMYAFDLQGKDVTVTIDRVVGGELTGPGGKKSQKPLCYFRESKSGKPLALNTTNEALSGDIEKVVAGIKVLVESSAAAAPDTGTADDEASNHVLLANYHQQGRAH